MKDTIESITPAEARRRMDAGGWLVLDVREAAEYADGHIPGAVSAPLSRLEKRAEELAPCKAQPIILYCLSGRRSALAARLLARQGYTRLADMGGIKNWPGPLV